MAKDFTIAIVGGGVGGLCLAAVIGKYDPSIKIDIYEKRATIEAYPNGIAVWKRPWQVLQEIGLEEELVKRNIPVPKDRDVNGPVFRMAGQQTTGYDFYSHTMPYNPTSIRRPVLSEILQARLPGSSTLHYSKKLSRYEQNSGGPVTLYFQDGSTAQADILVGVDGVNSAARATLFQSLANEAEDAALKDEHTKCIKPIFSGQLAYRCTAPLEKVKAENPNHPCLGAGKIWCGKDKHIVSTVSGEKVGVFVVIDILPNASDKPFDGPWVIDVPAQEVIDCFADWEPDVQNMVKHIEKPSRWAMHETKPLPLSVHGRIALLGDSVHAMLPHQGVGGGQVMEDAYLLGRLLAHPAVRLKHIPEVFKIYENTRLRPSQLAARRSRENGLMYDFRHPEFLFDAGSSREDLTRLGQAIAQSFKWLGEGSVMDDWQEAEQALDRILSAD